MQKDLSCRILFLVLVSVFFIACKEDKPVVADNPTEGSFVEAKTVADSRMADNFVEDKIAAAGMIVVEDTAVAEGILVAADFAAHLAVPRHCC